MDQISIGDLVEANALDYGTYVNRHRAICAIDGLKPVYRRVLLTAREMAREMKKVSTISGNVIAKYHPHGSASVDPVISQLVRWGLLEGQGNHGLQVMQYLSEGAPRYIEARYRPQLEDQLFKLVDYAPHFDNELGYSEPDYLITPIPIMLIYGTLGMGYGCDTRVPGFTYGSLLDAHKADDPLLLKSTYGHEILKTQSDLAGLWETGEGWLTYRCRVDWEWSEEDDCRVTIITGHGEPFTPRINALNQLFDEGRIFIRDESTTHIRLVIGRNKHVKALSDEQLYERCKDIATYRKKYRIRVNVFDTIRTIGIRDWLNITLTLFRDNFAKWQKDQIEKLEHNIKIHTMIPGVGQLLITGLSTEDIAKRLNRDIVLIKEIEAKPMRMLRRSDFTAEINKSREAIKQVSQSSPDTVIERFRET